MTGAWIAIRPSANLGLSLTVLELRLVHLLSGGLLRCVAAGCAWVDICGVGGLRCFMLTAVLLVWRLDLLLRILIRFIISQHVVIDLVLLSDHLQWRSLMPLFTSHCRSLVLIGLLTEANLFLILPTTLLLQVVLNDGKTLLLKATVLGGRDGAFVCRFVWPWWLFLLIFDYLIDNYL